MFDYPGMQNNNDQQIYLHFNHRFYIIISWSFFPNRFPIQILKEYVFSIIYDMSVTEGYM